MEALVRKGSDVEDLLGVSVRLACWPGTTSIVEYRSRRGCGRCWAPSWVAVAEDDLTSGMCGVGVVLELRRLRVTEGDALGIQ